MSQVRSRSRLTVVGDLHGSAARLEQFLLAIKNCPPRHVIFAGDFVNRGPATRRVLDLLLQVRDTHPEGATFIRGNHEQALLDFLDTGEVPSFVAHGGLATIRSYVDPVGSEVIPSFRSSFPPLHRTLLEETVSFYEDEDVLVSHAGFDPQNIHDRSPRAMYLSGYPRIFDHDGPWPKQLTICGHYIQRSGRPYTAEHLVCVDTGCGTLPDNPLTSFDYPERVFRQF